MFSSSLNTGTTTETAGDAFVEFIAAGFDNDGTEKNLPVTHVLAKSAQFYRADQLGRFKRRANIVRRLLREVPDQQSASTYETVLSFLFGESFVRRLAGLGRRFFKLIVAWPERELIHQVLRFDDVTRRMSGPFRAFVFEIKRNLGRTMPFVSDQK